ARYAPCSIWKAFALSSAWTPAPTQKRPCRRVCCETGPGRPHRGGSACSRQDPTAAFTESYGWIALSPAARLENDFVAIFQEGAGFATGQLQRPLAPLGDLQKAAATVVTLARQRARAEQVARLQAAAVDAVVRHHLRHGPVHVAGTAEGNPLRRQAFVAHGLGQQQHLQLDIQR